MRICKTFTFLSIFIVLFYNCSLPADDEDEGNPEEDNTTSELPWEGETDKFTINSKEGLRLNDPQEKVLIQSFVERGYDTFITRCADGRDMSKEAINEIGQGRVWTGEQAKERGLVDELGGIDKAIETAASLADLTDYSLTYVSGSKDFWKEFIEKQLGEVKVSVVKSVLGEEYEYFKTLNNIKSTTGVQARLPYDVKPL